MIILDLVMKNTFRCQVTLWKHVLGCKVDKTLSLQVFCRRNEVKQVKDGQKWGIKTKCINDQVWRNNDLVKIWWKKEKKICSYWNNHTQHHTHDRKVLSVLCTWCRISRAQYVNLWAYSDALCTDLIAL